LREGVGDRTDHGLDLREIERNRYRRTDSYNSAKLGLERTYARRNLCRLRITELKSSFRPAVYS
jgi:hypothetical protein